MQGSTVLVSDFGPVVSTWKKQQKSSRNKADVEAVNVPGDVPSFTGRAGASSNIDVPLASKHMVENISDWTVEDFLIESDHYIIHIIARDLRSRGVLLDVEMELYNLKRANCNRLQEQYRKEMPVALANSNNMAKK